MSNSSSPLLQTLTPERLAGWSMDFIGAGYVGLLVKNGQLVRKLEPGRHFSFALPWLEQCELILVDSKVRNLEVISRGDFLSHDQYLVNVSLSVMYQVVDPKRVALELSDPIAALISAIKDSLGVVVNQLDLNQLTQEGRVQIRQHLLSNLDTFYLLGFNLDDVRVSDISFPKHRGIIRQVEGLSARQEAEHEAELKKQIAEAERNIPLQQINIGAQSTPQFTNQPVNNALPDNPLKPTFVVLGSKSSAPAKLPSQADRPPLPPTALASDEDEGAIARLVHQQSGAIVILSANPFTIGREPHHGLVSTSPQCSRNHARIERVKDPQRNSCYQVTDVGSSNGTSIDGQRIAPHQPFPLYSGNIIKIGSDEWVFEV